MRAKRPVTNLVNPYWLSPKLYLVHNLTCVLCVLFGEKLAETVALVGHGDTVFWEMHVDYVSGGYK